MQELVKTQVDLENWANDDPHISYLIGAWTRICKILGKNFEQYLPIVMGPILKAAAFKPEVIVLADGYTDVEEDDNWEVLNVGNRVWTFFFFFEFYNCFSIKDIWNKNNRS
jgi:hypothetical protein